MNSQGPTEFEPSTEWVNEDDCDTLLLYLPGFLKEQLRVQLRSRTLIISGQRKLHDNTLRVFRKEFLVADNCDINKISAKFEGNILYVKQPKLTTSATKQGENPPTNAPTPVPENPTDKPKVHQEKAKYNSKPTSGTQPDGNQDVGNTVKDKPEKDMRENPIDERKMHQEKAKHDSKPTTSTQQNDVRNNPKDSREKDIEEKDDAEVKELKNPKGVCENASKKMVDGSGLVMKLKPSRNAIIKVLVLVMGFVMGFYWARSIQSWMA